MRASRGVADDISRTSAFKDSRITHFQKGSAEARAWFLDWSSVSLQAMTRAIPFPFDTLGTGHWDRLRIRLELRHSYGRRKTVASARHGTTINSR
jgi:hypothetical protein